MSSNAKKTLSYDFMDNYEKQRRELFSSPRQTSAIDAEHRRINAVLGSYEKAFNYLTSRYIGIVSTQTTAPVAPTKKAQSPSKPNPMPSNKRRHESIHQHKEQPQKKTRYCGGENIDPMVEEKRKNMTTQQQRPPPQNLQRHHYKQVPPSRAAYTPYERKPMLDHNRDQLRLLLKPPTTKIAMPIKEPQRPVSNQPPSDKYSRVPQQYLKPPSPIRDSQQEIKPHHNQIMPPQSLVEPATKRLYTDPMAREKRKTITTQRPPAQKLQRGHYKQAPPPKAPYKPENGKPMLEHNRDQLLPPIKPPTTKVTMPIKEPHRSVPQQPPSDKYSQRPQQYLNPPPPIRDSQQEPHSKSLIEPIIKRQEIKIENLTGKGKLPPGFEAEIRKFVAKNNERGCNFHKDFGRMRFWVRLYENRRVVVTLENKEMKVICSPDEAVFIRKNHR